KGALHVGNMPHHTVSNRNGGPEKLFEPTTLPRNLLDFFTVLVGEFLAQLLTGLQVSLEPCDLALKLLHLPRLFIQALLKASNRIGLLLQLLEKVLRLKHKLLPMGFRESVKHFN